MKISLSSKDLEILSAYLDDMLPPAERTRLEARLGSDPALREALESLRRTRAVLRAAPRVRAPRNFTLTPEMLAPRPSFFDWLRPTLQWSAALAALLFVLVFIGQGALTSRMAAQSEEMAPRLEAQAPAVSAETEGTQTAPQVPEAGADMQTPSLMMESRAVVTGTEDLPAADVSPTAEPPAEPPPPAPAPGFPWGAVKIALVATALVSAALARLLRRRR